MVKCVANIDYNGKGNKGTYETSKVNFLNNWMAISNVQAKSVQISKQDKDSLKYLRKWIFKTNANNLTYHKLL